MRFAVETWAPDYGAPVGDAVLEDSTATVDLSPEMDADAWVPITPLVPAATTVSFVDGVQRIDARVWVTDDEGVSHQGVCASWAAGVVRCNGRAEVISAEVRRGVLCSGLSGGVIDTRFGGYRAYPVSESGGDPIGQALGRQRGDLEGRVAVESRRAATVADRDLATLAVGVGPGGTGQTRSAAAGRDDAGPMARPPAGADEYQSRPETQRADVRSGTRPPATDGRPATDGDEHCADAGDPDGWPASYDDPDAWPASYDGPDAWPGSPGDGGVGVHAGGSRGATVPAVPAAELVRPRLLATGVPADDELLVVDGPLGDRRHIGGAVGYVKAHHVSYLSPAQQVVVGALAPGQRTPLFAVGAHRFRWSWYLRLPGPATHPWWGIVRCEASGELSRDAAVAVADRVAATLPRFASQPHNDARAPQNLHPIAGLERELRRRLGDPLLLERALRRAAASSS